MSGILSVISSGPGTLHSIRSWRYGSEGGERQDEETKRRRKKRKRSSTFMKI
jgi:hypothetical protein